MRKPKLLPMIAACLLVVVVIGIDLLVSAKRDVSKQIASTKFTEDDNAFTESEDFDYEDDYTYSWQETPIPPFLENYMDSTEWVADTICVVNDKAYYFGYDEYARTSVIFTSDELLCENPALRLDSVGTAFKTKFRISTAYTSMIVDFADRNVARTLKKLAPEYPCVKRFKKDYFSKIGRRVLYHIDIDFPKENNSYDDNLRKWLVQMIDESLDFEEENPYPLSPTTDHSQKNHSRYKGNIRDIESIGKFISERYFQLKKSEFGDDPEYFPFALFNNLSLRLVRTNGRYYSYQKQTHDYNDGAHGYYTQTIVSFDPKSNEEITWDYLFKPGNEARITSLFYHVVKNDPDYKEWENADTIEEIQEHFEADSTNMRNGKLILPKPGLTEKGVTFSYQPYEISCFAAGCFHFTIPYKDLKPFMTDKAKRLLGL